MESGRAGSVQSEISQTECDLERKTNNFEKPIGLLASRFHEKIYIYIYRNVKLNVSVSLFIELSKKYFCEAFKYHYRTIEWKKT